MSIKPRHIVGIDIEAQLTRIVVVYKICQICLIFRQ